MPLGMGGYKLFERFFEVMVTFAFVSERMRAEDNQPFVERESYGYTSLLLVTRLEQIVIVSIGDTGYLTPLEETAIHRHIAQPSATGHKLDIASLQHSRLAFKHTECRILILTAIELRTIVAMLCVVITIVGVVAHSEGEALSRGSLLF